MLTYAEACVCYTTARMCDELPETRLILSLLLAWTILCLSLNHAHVRALCDVSALRDVIPFSTFLCLMPVACIPRFQYVEFLYFISLAPSVGLAYQLGWLSALSVHNLECAMPAMP